MNLFIYRCERCGATYSLTEHQQFKADKAPGLSRESMEANPCRVCERGKGNVEYVGYVEAQ